MKKNSTWRILGLLLLLQAMGGLVQAQPFTYDNLITIPGQVTASWPTVGAPLDLYIRTGTHDFDPARPGGRFNGVSTYYYSINANAAQDNFHLLGPTLFMRSQEWAGIRQINELDTLTTIHWHGMELPAGNDGGPHETIPGVPQPVDVSWWLLDSAATFWYHPHLHNATLPQVQMGLSGMIYIDDDETSIDSQLPSTYGVDDIPLVIGDLGFTNNTSVPGIIQQAKGTRPYNVVNGVMNPYYTVPKAMVRLRILNGSTRKAIRFALSADTTQSSPLLPFYLVADDGGYAMHGGDQFTVLTIGPGSRTEIVIDLTGAGNGDNYYLRNLGSTMGPEFVGGHPGANAPGQGGNGNGNPNGDVTKGPAFIKLVVDTNIVGAVQTAPSWTRDWNELGLSDTATIDFRRTKYLVYLRTPTGGPDLGFVISDNEDAIPAVNPNNPTYQEALDFMNQNTFDMGLLNDVICVPSTEEWTIENRTPVAHPFHIHKIFFRITQIDSMDWTTNTVLSTIDIRAAGLDAPKDDVLIRPNWRLKWIGTFDDYGANGVPPADSGMMYHCHILTHEDALGGGMMHQFALQKDVPAGSCVPTVRRTEVKVEEKATLFPNPTDKELYLQGSSTKPSTVRIYDYQGRLLSEQTLGAFEGNVPVDITGMPRGLLLVEWVTAKGKVTKKVVIR
ncbi:MAG: multicopper oxidase domain-containing protein [Bacteroidia bacterium]